MTTKQRESQACHRAHLDAIAAVTTFGLAAQRGDGIGAAMESLYAAIDAYAAESRMDGERPSRLAAIDYGTMPVDSGKACEDCGRVYTLDDECDYDGRLPLVCKECS